MRLWQLVASSCSPATRQLLLVHGCASHPHLQGMHASVHTRSYSRSYASLVSGAWLAMVAVMHMPLYSIPLEIYSCWPAA